MLSVWRESFRHAAAVCLDKHTLFPLFRLSLTIQHNVLIQQPQSMLRHPVCYRPAFFRACIPFPASAHTALQCAS